MKAAPIVFLDFDGVTHPEVCKVGKLFSCLPLIEDVLRHNAQVDVVISSSWREHHPLTELREFFADDVSSRVVGCSPIAPSNRAMPAARNVRELECRTWLVLHRTDHPWIAIDDVSWLFEMGCPNLMLTNPRAGFTAADADRLHQMILEKSS